MGALAHRWGKKGKASVTIPRAGKEGGGRNEHQHTLSHHGDKRGREQAHALERRCLSVKGSLGKGEAIYHNEGQEKKKERMKNQALERR